MQNQQLTNGLEEFFQSSYPVSTTVIPVTTRTSSIVNTNDNKTSGSIGKIILITFGVCGIIVLGYYLIKKNSKDYEQDDNNTLF